MKNNHSKTANRNCSKRFYSTSTLTNKNKRDRAINSRKEKERKIVKEERVCERVKEKKEKERERERGREK